MKTCPLCGNKYSDSWTNWYSKYCCKECYKNSNTKFNLNDKVYTYINHKQGKSGILTAETHEATIVKIYKLNKPTTNGIYQYAVSFPGIRISYRFVHQIFFDKTECDKFVEKLNYKRQIIREANKIIKDVSN